MRRARALSSAALSMLLAAGLASPLAAAAPAISAGAHHSIAVRSDGAVRTWGSDSSGQLGSGRALDSPSPVQVPGLANVTQVAAGLNYSVARSSNGTLFAWGDNRSGQLGDGTVGNKSSPVRVLGVTGAASLSAQYITSYALRSDGTLLGWGAGPLGNGSASEATQALAVPGVSGVTALAVGGTFRLARKNDGSLLAWGWNSNGEVGDGTTTARVAPVAVALSGVTAVAAGFEHALALRNDGTVWAWGRNDSGQLGDGSTTRRLSPVQVPGLANIKKIFAGGHQSAALRADDTLVVWGNGTSSPQPLAGLGSVAVASLGSGHGLALRTDGTVWGWGSSFFGQLGTGNYNYAAAPVQVPGLASVVSISAGDYHSVVAKQDGTVWTFGANSAGQMGDGAVLSRSAPAAVNGLAGASAASAGYDHTLVLKADGTVWGIGYNYWGQLGDGGSTSRTNPVQATGLTGVLQVAAGSMHSLARTSDGSVWAWGYNADGELGDGSTSSSTVPKRITTLSGVVSIAASEFTSYAVKGDGTVWAWGSNFFQQQGLPSTTQVLAPRQVAGLASIIAVAGGYGHTLALASNGIVWALGRNGNGELGNGTQDTASSPVQVAGLTGVIAIAAAGGHSLALRADGTVWAWGANAHGELGDGTTTMRLAPVQVVGLTGIVAIAANGTAENSVGGVAGHNLALRNDGSLWAWGNSPYGQLGDSTYVSRTRPIVVVADGGAGSVEGGNWFQRLDLAQSPAIPAGSIPAVLVKSQRLATGGFAAAVKPRAADEGKVKNVYVMGLVPPEFLGLVKTAPGTPSVAEMKARTKAGVPVLVQLTPAGWATATGVLISYSTGVMSALGNSVNILEAKSILASSRFCMGYGDDGSDMLATQSLREVLALEGASGNASGLPCVLAGVYLDGPPSSVQSSPVTFTASVVGLAPSGTVQFRDGAAALGAPVALSGNNAVARAQLTTAALAVGEHSIGAHHSGDSLNAARGTEYPKLHVVRAALAQTRVELSGPSSSEAGATVALVAVVTGNNPSGLVRLYDGALDTGISGEVRDGVATLRIATLSAGQHSLVARYAGDASNAEGASAALAHTVVQVITAAVNLVSAPNPSPAGTPVTLTATVTGSAPTGNVSIRRGAETLATLPLVSGSASLQVDQLAAGFHEFTAHYSGDGANSVASSSMLVQQVSVTERTLAVSRAGNGSGTVTSSPAGIACGATCSASFTTGAVVTLNASAAAGSTFSGWSGAGCSGTSACVVTLNAAATVTATFTLAAGAPTGSASPTAVAFGGASVGTTTPGVAVTLTNVGTGTLTVSAVAVSDARYAQTHNCASLASGASCAATVTFAPNAAGAVNASLTFTTSAGNVVVALSGTGELSLVKHYYRAILNRAPEPGGQEFWEAERARLQAQGANVNEIWFVMANYFFNSAEYTSLGKTNDQFLADVYNTFFNRPPDGGGLAFWQGQMAAGLSREGVIFWFMFSNEFRTFTQGIFGNTAARPEVDMVMDLFRGLLNRFPDTAALNAFVGTLRQAQCTAQSQRAGAVYKAVNDISYYFIFDSGEYAARNRSNTQFVSDMYNAFLRRGGDDSEVDSWIVQLDQGTRSRAEIRAAFTGTGEFAARVNAVIAAGCVQ